MTKYEELKKQLEACMSSPHIDESLCDANRVIQEIADCNDLLLDQKQLLMELYYLVKARAKDPLRTK